MITALLGVPGKLKTLLDRLTSTRAGYLDNLSAGAVAPASTALSTSQWTNARAGYLDKLNISGNIADETTPMLGIPKASGISVSGNYVTAAGLFVASGNLSGLDYASTSSTSFADAINYTGSGVLSFSAVQVTTAHVGYMDIIIDGVTAASITTAATQWNTYALVGIAYADYKITLEPVPFKTSLQIRHKTASGGTVYSIWKVRKNT